MVLRFGCHTQWNLVTSHSSRKTIRLHSHLSNILVAVFIFERKPMALYTFLTLHSTVGCYSLSGFDLWPDA